MHSDAKRAPSFSKFSGEGHQTPANACAFGASRWPAVPATILAPPKSSKAPQNFGPGYGPGFWMFVRPSVRSSIHPSVHQQIMVAFFYSSGETIRSDPVLDEIKVKVILPETKANESLSRMDHFSKCIFPLNFDAIDSGFRYLFSTTAALAYRSIDFRYFVTGLRHMTLKLLQKFIDKTLYSLGISMQMILRLMQCDI